MALAVAGGPHAPFTYQGGKRALRAPTLAALGLEAGTHLLRLNDAGDVARFYQELAGAPEAVASGIRAYPPGREGFELARALVPAELGPAPWAAAYAVLQASTPLGKAPRDEGESWATAGYATVSPSGIARGFKDRLNPPALAAKVLRVGRWMRHLQPQWMQTDAAKLFWLDGLRPGDTVYLDPPYRKTTGYRFKFGRLEVVRAAEAALGQGCRVAIAEAETVELPGRKAEVHSLQRSDGRPLPKGRQEILTVYHP
jgi:hypothetical protein